jgi:hypothetical protein
VQFSADIQQAVQWDDGSRAPEPEQPGDGEAGRAMKFLLEVDMGETAFDGDAAKELGRILRYWGGNLHHCDLTPGSGQSLYDSGYREVGRWRVVESGTS